MSIITHFIDISPECVDGADMYRKWDLHVTPLATCSKNGDFLSHPHHIEVNLDMVCQPHDHFCHLGKMVIDFKAPH